MSRLKLYVLFQTFKHDIRVLYFLGFPIIRGVRVIVSEKKRRINRAKENKSKGNKKWKKKIKERNKKQIKDGKKYTGFFLTLLVLWMHTTLFYFYW